MKDGDTAFLALQSGSEAPSPVTVKLIVVTRIHILMVAVVTEPLIKEESNTWEWGLKTQDSCTPSNDDKFPLLKLEFYQFTTPHLERAMSVRNCIERV